MFKLIVEQGRTRQGSGRSRADRTRLRPCDGCARPFHWPGGCPANLPVDAPEIPRVPGEVGPNGLVGCATVLEGRATTPSRRPYPGRGQLSSPQFVREDPLAHAGRSTMMKRSSRIGAIRGFTSSHFVAAAGPDHVDLVEIHLPERVPQLPRALLDQIRVRRFYPVPLDRE